MPKPVPTSSDRGPSPPEGQPLMLSNSRIESTNNRGGQKLLAPDLESLTLPHWYARLCADMTAVFEERFDKLEEMLRKTFRDSPAESSPKIPRPPWHAINNGHEQQECLPHSPHCGAGWLTSPKNQSGHVAKGWNSAESPKQGAKHDSQAHMFTIMVFAGWDKNLPFIEQIAISWEFNSLCILVIMINTIYMGIVSDIQVKSSLENVGSGNLDLRTQSLITYWEFGFLTFYFVELLIKLVALKRRFFTGDEAWFNMFDLFVVLSGILDFFDFGYNFSPLRVIRAIVKLSKALRVFRLVLYFRELRLILLGIAHSMRTFFWSMVFLLVVMYVFGILFVGGVADYIRHTSQDMIGDTALAHYRLHWGSLRVAIYSEYKAVTGGSPWGPFADSLKDVGAVYFCLFIFYISLMVLAVFKLLVGMFIENARHAREKDYKLMVEHEMIHIFNEADSDSSGTISFSEFEKCIQSESAQEYWAQLNIKPSDARRLFSLMDESNDNQVSIHEFIDGCHKFSGWARNVDMGVAVSRIHDLSMHLVEFMAYVEECFDCHFGHRGDVPPPEEPLHERLKRLRRVRTSRVEFAVVKQLEADLEHIEAGNSPLNNRDI